MSEVRRGTSTGGLAIEGTVNSGPMPGYPKANLFIFWTFLAFVIFRYVDGGNRTDILAALRLEFLLGGAAVIMSSIKSSNTAVEIGNARPIVIMIVLLFVAMIVELPFAADPPKAERFFIDRVFKFSLLTFLIATLVESPKSLRFFLGAFLFAVFYVTLESTQGQITGSLVWQNQGVMRLHGATSIYRHPNSLSGLAMGALPFVIFLYGPLKRRLVRLGLLALATTSLVCVIFSGSRTSYLGMISLLLWWFFQSRRKGRFVIFAVVVGVVAVPLIPKEYVERFKSIVGQESEGHSKGTRIEILRDAVTILKENPLGVGVASFPAARQARFGRLQDTHNLYLEVATNLGVQGLVIFLGFVAVVLISLRDSALKFRAQQGRLVGITRKRGLPRGAYKRIREHYVDLDLCLAVAQATGGFIVVRLVLGLFGMDLYEIYWWFSSGVAISLAGLAFKMNRRTKFFAFVDELSDQ